MNNFLINVAHAEGHAETVAHEGTTTAVTEAKAEASHESGGLSIQPTTIAFQALNLVLLIVVLNLILYKPLVKLISTREKKIHDGVENAEKAENMLKESNQIRTDMIKGAKAESQSIVEKGRKAGEELKNSIVSEAQEEAGKIIKSGQMVVDSEKAKAMQEVKAAAVNTIIMAAEKLLKEKIDPARDARMIEESLKGYTA